MFRAMSFVVAAAATSCLGQGPQGACPSYTTSLLSTWDRTAPQSLNDTQHPDAAWRYLAARDGGVPLQIFRFGSQPLSWGDLNQPFSIPAFGPRYSPTPARNQVQIFRRNPSFEGLYFHPGNDTIDLQAVFAPAANTTLFSFTLQGEHLGNFSPDSNVQAYVLRANGTRVTLVPTTTLIALAPAVTRSPAPGVLPIVLASGDRVIVSSNSGNSPFEDWVNLNATMTLNGAPVFIAPPKPTTLCAGGDSTTLSVVVDGAAPLQYRWQRRDVAPNSPWVNLANGPLLLGGVPVATVSGATTSSVQFSRDAFGTSFLNLTGYFRCVVSDACLLASNSPEALIRFCVGDFNCDDAIDGDDVIAFFSSWDLGLPDADMNGDQSVDGDDVIAFFAAWDTQCA